MDLNYLSFSLNFIFDKMRLKNLFTLSSLGVVVLGLLLFLSCALLWRLHQYESGSEEDLQKYSMFFNKYTISRSSMWNSAFQETSTDKYPKIHFEQKGPSLIIGSKFLAQIGHEGEHYQEQTISSVIDLSQKSQKKHFLVRSEANQQLFYLPSQSHKSNKFQKLEKCLQLDKVELKDKLNYFVDGSGNFWLISHPHNNVLFIQVYDCENQRLLTKIFHEPEHNGRAYMVNEVVGVEMIKDSLYEVKLLTYESHEYIVRIHSDTYTIQQTQLNPSHNITSTKVPIHPNTQSNTPSYTFLDPLNKIFDQQFNHLMFSTVQNYMEWFRILLNTFGIQTRSLNFFLKEKLKEHEKEKEPEYLDYDVQLRDENNDCLVNLQYHLHDTGNLNSSLTRLGQHLLDTRTPVFHNIANYDQYDILQVLKNEKIPPVSEFKRVSLDKGYQKEYTSNYFYSIYHTYPDSKVHFLGAGEKTFYLYPNENAKDDEYMYIRTRTGGLVMQGSKIKGAYEDRPLTKDQVRQKLNIEANQVVPGIWEAHAGYQALFSVRNGNKLELINGLSGKTLLTYTINLKQGYQYAGCSLFNNEWWIILYNTHTEMSELVKQEFYLEKAYAKQVDAIKRTYGKLAGSEFQEGEDDLREVFKEYLDSVSDNGVVVLDIFRCHDEFYYIQLCDSKGENYAIARIHFKRFSNRLPKKSGVYATELEARLIVQPKDMVKETQKMDPFIVALSGESLFEGVSKLIQEKNFQFKNFTVKTPEGTQKLVNFMKKLNQFDVLPYAVISHQLSSASSSNQQVSTQEIKLLNMRVLVENGKKKFMIETRMSAKKRVMYLTIFVIVILLCSIVKLLISGDLKKIQQQKDEEKSKQSTEENVQSPQKSKGKKQKTK